MSRTLTIALSQLNPTVGDIDGNISLISAARDAASGARLVVCGELAVSGYPPEDLVLRSDFQDLIEDRVRELAAATADGGPAVLLGSPWRGEGALHNASLLLDGGRIAAVGLKHELPNYGVFDEKRIFTAGPCPEPMVFDGVRLGVMICEDMWEPEVTAHLKEAGADILIVLNGSPFELDKPTVRRDRARARTAESGLPLIYVNLVGGQDELVFDGGTFVIDCNGDVQVLAAAWESATVPSHWRAQAGGAWACEPGTVDEPAAGPEAIYRALITGLGDYVGKNAFAGVLIGLSGGIDSALTAAVAVDALGPEKVHCVMMPSPYTSPESLEDAAETARLLGVRLDNISITPAMNAFGEMLSGSFAGHSPDVTEENIQSRSRGLTLMALSNKLGFMVLSTGNKSEMSVGYATIYGDMCGGFSVLKDVYKSTVFALARWRNLESPKGALGPAGPVMPERVITKPPSAELRPGQTDQDSLPPYDELDAILKCLIEEELSLKDVTARGFDAEVARKVWQLLDRAEYKRRQAPPGVKITSRAFGRDRRYPLTNEFSSLK